MTESLDQVLLDIEKFQKDWKYVLPDISLREHPRGVLPFHSYGRIPEDGNEIRAWSVPRRTGEYLCNEVIRTNSKIILELGTSLGYSTLFLAKGAEKTNGTVYTIDCFKPKIEIAKRNFARCNEGQRIELIEGEIEPELAKWEGQLDIVFMDADKERYEKYYELIIPKLRKGGIIIADNAGNYAHHMKGFIKTAMEDPKVDTQFLDMDNGLLVIVKK